MTRADHPSGTDRLAEVASSETAELYVNIQGDEPLIDPEAIDAAILSVLGDEDVSMGTLKKQIEDPAEIANPNVVKVVTGLSGDALYFSRSPIPHFRDSARGKGTYFKHIGLYVYRRNFLLQYPDLDTGPLERAECLEQLRALENGYRIRVVETGVRIARSGYARRSRAGKRAFLSKQREQSTPIEESQSAQAWRGESGL